MTHAALPLPNHLGGAGAALGVDVVPVEKRSLNRVPTKAAGVVHNVRVDLAQEATELHVGTVSDAAAIHEHRRTSASSGLLTGDFTTSTPRDPSDRPSAWELGRPDGPGDSRRGDTERENEI